MNKIPEIKVKVSYRNSVKYDEMIGLRSPDDTAEFIRPLFNTDTMNWTEEVVMVCLNRANKVIGYYKISSGGTTASLIDPKVVFTIALNCTASGLILAHNHPSGNRQASAADIEITKKIKEAGSLLDIKLIDHIILTSDGYTSMVNEDII